MEWDKPKGWISISESQMQSLLDNTQYTKQGWSNGFAYIHRHNKQEFAFEYDNGRYVADPNGGDKVAA